MLCFSQRDATPPLYVSACCVLITPFLLICNNQGPLRMAHLLSVCLSIVTVTLFPIDQIQVSKMSSASI